MRVLLIAFLVVCIPVLAQEDLDQVPAEEWIQLFNGVDLTDWVPSVAGFESGQDPYNYFYVEDSILWVDYTDYPTGAPGIMGTLGNMSRKFSYFLVRAFYQFWGEQAPGGPSWAKQNNGIMYHCQSMESMRLNDNFPWVSMETQLLGENNNQNDDGTTANLCTIGATAVKDGIRKNFWCEKATPKDIMGLEWVKVEVLVLGDSIVKHIVEDDTVMEYGELIFKEDEGNVPEELRGLPMTEGYIAIQAESAPTKFKTIEILDLVGCTDPSYASYRSYFLKSDPNLCTGALGCMNPNSSNFDALAQADDGSCLACTNPEASNYDAYCDTHECVDDGSCEVAIDIRMDSKPVTFVNSAASRVQFSILSHGAYSVRLLDTRGNQLDIVSGQGPVRKQSLHLPNPGIYFVEASSPSGISVKKILNF